MTSTCLWCGQPYEPGGRGSPQKFCSAAHRRAFDQAARDWVRQAIEIGALTVEQVQNASRKARALATEALAGVTVSDSGNVAKASGGLPEGGATLKAAQRAGFNESVMVEGAMGNTATRAIDARVRRFET